MDMTRDFLNGILEMGKPHEIDYADRKFTDKCMTALPRVITARALHTNTLTSIVDYIKSGTDSTAIDKSRFVIHVVDFDQVQLYKEMNKDKTRDSLITASIDQCRFPFGSFMSVEQFIINLQSLFVQNDKTAALLEFIGSVQDDTSVKQQDDGVTQKVVAKTGVSLAKAVPVPNPVFLKPFRTFSEIDQPESAFVFRVRKDEMRGVTAALFEADGAAWKHEAILKIKQYFEDALTSNNVIILA